MSNFCFDTEQDGDVFRSLKGLTNHNNGVWRSRKQREFLMRNPKSPLVQLAERQDRQPDQNGVCCVLVGGSVRVPGRYVNVTWMFQYDEAGVVALYKLRHIGRETLFKREGEVDTSHLEETQEERDAKEARERQALKTVFQSKKIGAKGDRVTFEGVLEGVAERDGDYGTYYLNWIKDQSGNLILISGRKLGERGDSIQARATVKDHFVNRQGAEVTRMNRPYMVSA